MIGIIRVVLTKGELNGEEQLRGIAASLYPNELQLDQSQATQGIQRYITDLTSTYTCIPRNASRASFLWLDAQEFEIVVETFYQGNLIYSVEGIVRRLSQRLKQLGVNADITVRLQASGDARTYIVGDTSSISAYLWGKLRDNLVAISVAVLIIIIAKIWFQDFYHEAIVGLISLVLLSLWQAYRAWKMAQNREVHWRIHEQTR
jgi:hypothetical protein